MYIAFLVTLTAPGWPVGAALGQAWSGPVYEGMMTSEYNHGNLNAAEQIGAQLLRTEPTNLAVHYLLGNIYVKTNRVDRAVQEYNYCLRVGRGSQVGSFAAKALTQIQSQPTAAPTPVVETCPPVAAAPARAPTPAAAEPLDKVDLQLLEYKERLLKTGTDLIEANRAKLQKQIQSVQSQNELTLDSIPRTITSGRGGSMPNPDYANSKIQLAEELANKIKSLQDTNAADEKKITDFYNAQVASIDAQKRDLRSQTVPGNGGVRLVQQGSGMFVRNYINYHGDMPLPPLPPELHAIAKRMTDEQSKSTAKAH